MSRVRTEASLVLGGSHEHYARYLEPPYQQGSSTNTAATSANRCWYSPIRIPFICTVDGIIVAHAGTAGGNVMTALYESSSESPTNRLAVSNVYPCNGTTRKDFVPFTSYLQLQPAYDFLAMWTNTTDTYYQGVLLTGLLVPAGVDDGPSWYFENAGAGGPPATATPTGADAPNETVWMMLRIISIP